MTIALLALQGAFIEHIQMLTAMNIDCFEIRKKEDLNKPFDGLILPGGESTVMSKFLHEREMLEPLKARILSGLPTFGTCAGLILLSKNISNDNRRTFELLDITTLRNAYGRQLGSFETLADVGEIKDYPCVFIRAPLIEKAGENVEILARVDGNIVAARQGNILVTSFHPELTKDTRIHELFVDMIKKN